MLLDNITNDNDLKKLNNNQLELLASEIRSFLVQSISKTGGHLASNLGVVELTLALHKVFDLSENDSVIWDVGHQCYTHKILTGRKDKFSTLRKMDGISGFPKTEEDESDSFNTGHSSTSVSAAAGIAKGKELSGINGKTIAVIGDGAMTGGMAFEALNHAGHNTKNLIVILNDNDMSISKNVGGMSKALKHLRNANKYLKLKNDVKLALDNIPVVGVPTKKGLSRVKNDIKKIVIENDSFFEGIGYKYMGPVDGHNFEELLTVLNHTKKFDRPIFIHIYTKKGKGYPPAEKFPWLFHGVGSFDPKTGKILKKQQNISWSEHFGNCMLELGKRSGKVVAVTAAMPDGTGLYKFADMYPNRFFDVGIAEQHAVTFSAGLAKTGYIPVFAVYSTFLQRAYDQILHDVALQNLHVIFAVDRSGPVGEDGETHQGVYDISYLSHIPNMTILSPAIDSDLSAMLEYAVNHISGPVAIRYPRGAALSADEFSGVNIKLLNDADCLKSRVIKSGNNKCDAAIISTGVMLKNAVGVCDILNSSGITTCLIDTVVIKPIDINTIRRECDNAKIIVTIENNVDTGGFGQQLEALLGRDILRFAYADVPVVSGSIPEIEKKYGMDSESIAERIKIKLHEIEETDE